MLMLLPGTATMKIKFLKMWQTSRTIRLPRADYFIDDEDAASSYQKDFSLVLNIR